MKKKLLIIIIIYFNFTTCNSNSQELIKPDSNKSEEVLVITSKTDCIEDNLLYSNVKFTNAGLRCFFTHKFNNPRYAQDFLPHNLSDLIQFLQYAKSTNQNKKSLKSIFKMFHQKIKAVEYISGREFTKLLDLLPELTEYVFVHPNIVTNPQTKIKDILYNEFLNKYEIFRQDPHIFFNNLSDRIFTSMEKNETIQTNDISNSELKGMILRFIENACSKLVWFVEDEPDIWVQFNQTCNVLCKLRIKNLIEDLDDINDLIHSALAKFKLILEIRGSALSSEFYEKAFNEAEQNTPSWLDIEEQDESMKTKKEILLQTLKTAHAKSFARDKYGIIS